MACCVALGDLVREARLHMLDAGAAVVAGAIARFFSIATRTDLHWKQVKSGQRGNHKCSKCILKERSIFSCTLLAFMLSDRLISGVYKGIVRS